MERGAPGRAGQARAAENGCRMGEVSVRGAFRGAARRLIGTPGPGQAAGTGPVLVPVVEPELKRTGRKRSARARPRIKEAQTVS